MAKWRLWFSNSHAQVTASFVTSPAIDWPDVKLIYFPVVRVARIGSRLVPVIFSNSNADFATVMQLPGNTQRSDQGYQALHEFQQELPPAPGSGQMEPRVCA